MILYNFILLYFSKNVIFQMYIFMSCNFRATANYHIHYKCHDYLNQIMMKWFRYFRQTKDIQLTIRLREWDGGVTINYMTKVSRIYFLRNTNVCTVHPAFVEIFNHHCLTDWCCHPQCHVTKLSVWLDTTKSRFC